jgi:hypothetical protein
VRAGGDAAEMKISDDIPSHIISMIQAVPPDEAAAVIANNLTLATKVFSARDKVEEAIDKDLNEINTRAYNAILSIDDFDLIDQSTLKSLMPESVYNQLPDRITSQEQVDGVVAKSFLAKGLKDQFWANAVQISQIDNALETNATFASTTNDANYTNLYVEAQNGMLTMGQLNTNKILLTREDYISLAQIVSSQGNTSLNQGKRLMSTAFNYQAGETADDALSRASKNAYANAENALIFEFNKNKALGKTMTLSEILNFAQAQVAEFGEAYFGELKAGYIDYITRYSSDQLLGYSIDPKDPRKSIDEWFNSLTAEEQKTDVNRSKRNRFLSRLREYENKDLF